jgi:hypothetical protein
MTTTSPPLQSSNTSQSPGQNHSVDITPELVEKVAAKVYALLLADLRTERERRTFSSQRVRDPGGGRYDD